MFVKLYSIATQRHQEAINQLVTNVVNNLNNLSADKNSEEEEYEYDSLLKELKFLNMTMTSEKPHSFGEIEI